MGSEMCIRDRYYCTRVNDLGRQKKSNTAVVRDAASGCGREKSNITIPGINTVSK